MASSDKTLRVVVYKDGDSLVAQCLEHDICAFARDEESLKRRFMRTFVAEWNLALHSDGEPLEDIDPAPKEFHDLWDMAGSPSHLAAYPASIEMAHAA